MVLDDQALVVHVRDRGLVVLTGRGHAGVVNIVRQAVRLTGVHRLHALIGGLHLSGPAFEPIIPPTVATAYHLTAAEPAPRTSDRQSEKLTSPLWHQSMVDGG